MVRGVEEAAVVCAECGLKGKLMRQQPNGRIMVFAGYADFEALCRKVVPNYVQDCPYWVEAQRAAIPLLRPQPD